jgi:hypothetical protein
MARMVEFCRHCKGSLPTGDLTIRKGQKYTSHDYLCPACGKLANPPERPKRVIEPDPDRDIVVSGGESRIE